MTQDNLQPPSPDSPPTIQNIPVIPAPLNTTNIILQIYGWFLMIIGLLILLIFCSTGLAASLSGEPDGVVGGLVFIVIGFFVGLFMGSIGFISLKVVKAIQERKNWGKTFGIIMGIFIVLQFPIGTLAAVFIFIGLFSKEAEGWFID
ncbi:hypothetical protein KAU33_01850 [Candidatus Dependentiae bacterium]|nr:hypothetical protein [Candidatus Dependentiae bacterium]